jgi:hypothetical protein
MGSSVLLVNEFHCCGGKNIEQGREFSIGNDEWWAK